jgi:hypothetical protein
MVRSTFNQVADACELSQILAYNEPMNVWWSVRAGQQPSYVVFVTDYKDGVIPERLQKGQRAGAGAAGGGDARVVKKATFMNADDEAVITMRQGALYGVYFDTDRDGSRSRSRRCRDREATESGAVDGCTWSGTDIRAVQPRLEQTSPSAL